MHPCQYIVGLKDGSRTECGAAATHRGAVRPRKFYCDVHAHQVWRHLELINLSTKESLGKPVPEAVQHAQPGTRR